MSLAKKYGKNPRVIAEEIISNFDDRFENVNIAGPGFINVSINKNQLLNVVSSSLKDLSYLIDKDKNKTIIIDYGGTNAAKTLHIGHMRSARLSTLGTASFSGRSWAMFCSRWCSTQELRKNRADLHLQIL